MSGKGPRGAGRFGADRHARRCAPCAAAILLLLVHGAAFGATLRTNAPYASNGLTAVPIWLSPASGDQVASLQFQLRYDTSAFSVSRVEISAAARQAGKDVVFAEHDGWSTIIVAGLNQGALSNGLLATVYLEPLGNGATPEGLAIASPVLSDPEGKAVALGNDAEIPDETNSNPEPSPGGSTGDGDSPTPETPQPTTSDAKTPTTNDNRLAQRNYGSPYYPGSANTGSGLNANGKNTPLGNASGLASSNPSGVGGVAGAGGASAYDTRSNEVPGSAYYNSNNAGAASMPGANGVPPIQGRAGSKTFARPPGASPEAGAASGGVEGSAGAVPGSTHVASHGAATPPPLSDSLDAPRAGAASPPTGHALVLGEVTGGSSFGWLVVVAVLLLAGGAAWMLRDRLPFNAKARR